MRRSGAGPAMGNGEEEKKLLGIVRELLDSDVKFDPDDKQAVQKVVEAIFRARSRKAVYAAEHDYGRSAGLEAGREASTSKPGAPPAQVHWGSPVRDTSLRRAMGAGRNAGAVKAENKRPASLSVHHSSGVKKTKGTPGAGGAEKAQRRLAEADRTPSEVRTIV